MRIHGISILLLIFFYHSVLSQSDGSLLNTSTDTKVLYRNEATGGIIIHNRGFGANFKRLKHVTGTNKRFIEFELVGMRHPKEYKLKTEIKSSSSRGYYYGKLNKLTMFRVGLGNQKTLYRRAERKSVEVRFSYSLGPNFTLVKPVYLYVFEPSRVDPLIEKYDPNKHKLDDIAGRAPFVYGISDITVRTGAFTKLAFSFDFAEYVNEVQSLEAGLIIDAFPKPISIMAENRSESVFFTLFVSYTFGKKWF